MDCVTNGRRFFGRPRGVLGTVLGKGIYEDEVGGAESRRGRGRDVMVIIEGGMDSQMF